MMVMLMMLMPVVGASAGQGPWQRLKPWVCWMAWTAPHVHTNAFNILHSSFQILHRMKFQMRMQIHIKIWPPELESVISFLSVCEFQVFFVFDDSSGWTRNSSLPTTPSMTQLPVQIFKYMYTNTNTQTQRYKYRKYTNTQLKPSNHPFSDSTSLTPPALQDSSGTIMEI